MSTISNDYSFPMQNCQKCVLDRNVHHFKITTLFLYKYAKIASTKHNTTLSLPKQAKIAHTKCPPYQSLHIYCTNKPKLRSPCVHYINHYTFTIQTSQNCVHQINHYTFTMQKRSFGGFWTHTNRFQLCCSSPSDFKSVVVIHQISTLMR